MLHKENMTLNKQNILKTNKILIIVIFSLFIAICTYSQPLTWQRILNNDFGGVSKVLQTNDGGFAAIGSTRLNNEYKINLTKLDKYGNILWVKIYGIGYANARWAEITNDNGFNIGGYSDSAVGNSKVFLVKTDSSGNIQWQRYYSFSSLDQGNCVKQTIDNGFILVGRTTLFSYSSIILIKVDNVGNVQWNKIMNFGVGVSIQELLILEQGYLLAGWINNNPSDILIIKTNNVGDTIWSKVFGGTNTDAAYSSETLGNFGYLIGGYSSSYNTHSESYLLKLDTSGNLIWQKTYSGVYSEECSGVKYKPGLGYILAGSADTANFLYTRALIKIVDTNGVLIKQVTFFPADRGGWFNDLELANDGGYILGGTANVNSASNMYVAKTDSLLHAEPIGISVITQNIPEEFSISQNYPNPFNPATKIKFDISGKSVAQTFLSVYDIQGKLIATLVDKQLKPGSYEVTYESSGLSSGVYFYRINAGDFTDTKIMILLK